MRPPLFEIARPANVGEAIHEALGPQEGMFYSGGTELLLAMKLRVIHTDKLIDIKGIRGLSEIAHVDEKTFQIGARCTHSQIEQSELVQRILPTLAQLCGNVANVRVRNAGTIGGNLCFGEPHADPPTLLAALGARLCLSSIDGERLVDADDFILDEFETVREPHELLTRILIPIPNGPVVYQRFRHGERPAVNAAMLWSLDPSGRTIANARIRIGALGARPQRLERVEAALCGVTTAEAAQAVSDVLGSSLDSIDVTDDRHGSAEYKRHLAGVLLRRNIAEAETMCRERRR
ncbi:FAD binding domain-containing protein [Pseudorhodoplanes sinuspersici]|uniref:Carbon monoxide dehydrogenase n=1 Tax=Pseudorhodoplanes sinuspersici TaxID=1235591 RepID=A0A1W6ZRQ6_9HYPH|nr:FAD binding domain-containing protein [Pseudorhodoplanes sinuspersici]ARQ00099.1 carbon monoxide dehydrogenase [Pseudorhodoplanes sinuspersici]RKE71140.1 carbon-monoxide dehydrogenase medium subunit [Pseudorhodoplanes sinuspersici]